MSENLNEKLLTLHCEKLAKTDGDLGFVYEKYGTPPLWDRPESFSTLINIILEQQVSLASALSAFNKLKARVKEITPENILKLNDAEFRACYFSRQKTGYARNLANAITSKKLVLSNLQSLPDEDVKTELIKIKGIGRWTADIYLIMVLLRPDIMPKGDIALHAAYKNLKNLEKRPGSEEFLELTQSWKPFRSTAARLLWHFYLCEKKMK